MSYSDWTARKNERIEELQINIQNLQDNLQELKIEIEALEYDKQVILDLLYDAERELERTETETYEDAVAEQAFQDAKDRRGK